jgi:hypothetical protein
MSEKKNQLYDNELYTIGYSANDFYYVKAQWDPTDSSCDAIPQRITDNSCSDPSLNPTTNTSFFTDNSYNCMLKQICNNKNYAGKMKSVVYSHLGSGENYDDTQKLYQEQYKKLINNGISIFFVLFMIFYSNK